MFLPKKKIMPEFSTLNFEYLDRGHSDLDESKACPLSDSHSRNVPGSGVYVGIREVVPALAI